MAFDFYGKSKKNRQSVTLKKQPKPYKPRAEEKKPQKIVLMAPGIALGNPR